jgi:hypothetical protein
VKNKLKAKTTWRDDSCGDPEFNCQYCQKKKRKEKKKR